MKLCEDLPKHKIFATMMCVVKGVNPMNLKKLNIEKAKEIAKISKEKAMDKAVSLKGKAGQRASALKEKAIEKYEGSNVDLTVLKNVHFNFHHFTSVCIVAVLAFFVTLYSTGFNTAEINAAGLDAPKVETYNKEMLSVNYGDTKAIANVAKEVLGDQVSDVIDLKEVSNSGMTAVYELDSYMVTVEMENTSGTGEKTAKLEVETKATFAKSDAEKVVVNSTDAKEVNDGSVYVYQLKLNVVDTEAPRINISETDMTIDDTDEFDVNYFVNVTDNVDGVVSDYSVEGMPAKNGDKWESGKHVLTIRSKDSSGNEAAAEMIVRIYETEEEVAPVAQSSNNASRSSNYGYGADVAAGSYAGGNAVASAALGQLGIAQDCTALVTNALRAVGIYFHDWPAGYLSLGTVVSASQAQPGDLIYYADGGVGAAHIAVYIGNGQAVHGGYLGSTRIASAYMGSGPVFIRLR